MGWGLIAAVLGKITGRTNIIDTLWPFGFLLVAVVGLVVVRIHGHGDLTRQVLVVALTAIWSLRLGVYVGLRSAGKGDDRRYVTLLERHGGGPVAALRYVYAPQTLVLFVVSSTLLVSLSERGGFGPAGWAGVLVWAIGLSFEAVGDRQLERFRMDPAQHGTLIRTGLWRYTRHPNYFGDAVVWTGLWLLGADHWQGLPVVVAPIVMTVLLVSGTGKRLLEQSMRSRPGWAEYARQTSGFVPMPPRVHEILVGHGPRSTRAG